MLRGMDTPRELSKYLSKLGKKGGKARTQAMSADERRELARKAGIASGKARRSKKKSAE